MLRRWLRDQREGWRILTSRAFWRDFRDFYSGDAIAARLDRVAERMRAFNERGRP